MSEGNVKELLTRNLEKVVVGVVAIIILVYLLSLAASSSEAEKLKRDADEYRTKIQDARSNPEIDDKISVGYAKEVQSHFKNVPEEGVEPQWFAFKRPYVVRSARFTSPLQPVHLAPSLAAKSDVGQVELSWADAEGNQNVRILGYVLRRKEGEEGEWMKLKEFDPETGEFVDRTVRPDMPYSYKLTSRAEPTDPKTQLPNEEEESGTADVVTPFNMKFVTDRMYWSGSADSPDAKLWVTVVVLQPGGEETQAKAEGIKRGDMIIVQGMETGWKLKDFGEKKIGPGRAKKFIVIVNSQDKTKTKQFPPEQTGDEETPEDADEPDEPETPPDEPDEPETPPSDPGGGWLPPRK